MADNLKSKTIKGTFWSAADTFLAHGVAFVVGIVLARLLTPEEYGLIGIVTIFTTIMLNVVDCGFSNAIIRKQEVTNEDYSTLFIFNFVVSVAMFVLLFLGAPWIADFFERQQLVSLVRVMGLLLVIQALSIVQNTILSRKIDFKTKTKASVISAISSGVIGIALAFGGFGVWSLVAQQLSRQLVYTICLWIFNKWWPVLKVNMDSLCYMWGFGWKLLISGTLDSIWKELYQTVVGKCYSPATLGQYTRSRQYAQLFSSNLTTIIQRVTFPVLSNLQSDKARMVNGYRRIIKTSMFVTAVLMIFMAAIAEPMIYCLIGPQWHVAATFLPLICISLSLYPLHAINLNMLQVQGKTDVYLIIEILKKIISIGPLCLGVFIDIYWMLMGSIVTGILAFFINSYYSGRMLGYSSWAQIKDVAPSYAIAFFVAVSVYFLKYLPVSYWIVLPIQMVVGIIVFFILCETIKLSEYIEVKSIAMEYIKKMKHKTN